MSKRQKQLEFSELGFKRPSDVFGGSLLTSNPKTKRPLDAKYATLVTLRSNRSGMRSFSKFEKVNSIVRETAKKYGIAIYDFANEGNHLHILIKLSHKRFWAPFIRELTSRIAFLFETKAERKANGDSDKDSGPIRESKSASSLKFWKYRPHTAIIRSWQKAFRNAKEYIQLNKAEAGGFIKRSQVKNLKEYRRLFELAPISMKDPPLRGAGF